MSKKSLFVSLFIILVFTFIPMFFYGDTETIGIYLQVASYTMLVFMCAFMVQYFYEKNKEDNKDKRSNDLLKINLDNKEVWLIDYENCPYIPNELLGREDIFCFVFANFTQRERVISQLRLFDSSLPSKIIYSSKTGKNLVDIEIGTYVGLINGMYNPTKIIIYSKDKGYSVVFESLENINITNVSLVNASQELLIPEQKCKSIYKKIICPEGEMSLGNFRKKLKKISLNITPDEVNFLINYYKEENYIEIIDVNESKKVVLKK